MQFGWVSSTHSLSHASKLRKKSHDEIQLTTKNQNTNKSLGVLFTRKLLGNHKPLLRSKQQRKSKEQMKINSHSYSFSSYKRIRNPLTVYELKDNKKPGKSQSSTRNQIIFGIQSHTKIIGYSYNKTLSKKILNSSQQSRPIRRSLQHKK
jgi:hypothetical protein